MLLTKSFDYARYVAFLALMTFFSISRADDASEVTPETAKAAMQRATVFFTSQVAVHGGYVYYTSLDLSKRWGEGVASKDQIWVQPPGTPTVGLAFLSAYEATRDPRYLTAARDAGAALAYGQLQSGGWTNSIDFDSRSRNTALYRIGKGSGKNNSTLDDGITQEALRFLIKLDQIEQGKNGSVREAVKIGLLSLLNAQFPNGAFPQIWTGPTSSSATILPAQYPDDDWRVEGRVKEYWNHYTLNDGLAGTVTSLLIDASEAYPTIPGYKAAIIKLGDFLVSAQMPEPQPAWAQQYDTKMHPAWARKFEPPAVSGYESQDVIATLLRIYEVTGDDKYLKPIEPALNYLKASLLSDGRLARFYELKTNRPLYMNTQYQLTYNDDDLPDHYGWKVPSRLESLYKQYTQIKSGTKPNSLRDARNDIAAEAANLIAQLDSEGRWISTANNDRMVGQPKMRPGEKYLSSQRFAKSLTLLAEYVLAAESKATAEPQR